MRQRGENQGKSITSDDPNLLMSVFWRLVGVVLFMHADLVRIGRIALVEQALL